MDTLIMNSLSCAGVKGYSDNKVTVPRFWGHSHLTGTHRVIAEYNNDRLHRQARGTLTGGNN